MKYGRIKNLNDRNKINIYMFEIEIEFLFSSVRSVID
jgi:hypothetical protein